MRVVRLLAQFRVLIVLSSVASLACGGTSSSPSGNPGAPATSRYTGQWNGTTGQGARIAFTVIAERQILTLTVGHNFRTCSGEDSLTDLTIPIYPASQLGTSSDGFTYAARISATSGIQITGFFFSGTVASGTVGFIGYPNCGDEGTSWTAMRQ